MAEDYSYIGTGNIYLREVGMPAPLVEVGNCSVLSLSPQEDVLEQRDYTQPGGGTRNEVRRLTGVEIAYTFHDYSPGNFARALRGDAHPVTAGQIENEAMLAWPGGFVPLAFMPTAVTAATDPDGAVTYAEGNDYEVRAGGLFVPAASSIPEPEDGAPNLRVTYAHGAQTKVQALIHSGRQYELVFAGQNEARGGKQTRVSCFRVSAGLLQQMALIGDEYGAGEVTGKLLIDPTKVGTGVSRYFTFEVED